MKVVQGNSVSTQSDHSEERARELYFSSPPLASARLNAVVAGRKIFRALFDYVLERMPLK